MAEKSTPVQIADSLALWERAQDASPARREGGSGGGEGRGKSVPSVSFLGTGQNNLGASDFRVYMFDPAVQTIFPTLARWKALPRTRCGRDQTATLRQPRRLPPPLLTVLFSMNKHDGKAPAPPLPRHSFCPAPLACNRSSHSPSLIRPLILS